jgi:predicted kinase
MADVLGRECAGRSQLVESVDMFREYAEELGCGKGPRQFEHDHHRFMYCVGRKPIDYVPYVCNDAAGEPAFEVILMSGLPGGGKSTVARRIAVGRPIISLDEIRDRLDIDGGDDQSPVIAAAKEQAMTLLRRRQSFVWDATNTTKDLRSGLIALFANYGATTRIVYVEAPSWQELFARNRNRERQVPESVIIRLAERLEIPSMSEAHRIEYVA